MARLLLYPAIDLMDGQVVRLRQGKASEKTVYSSDPAGFARRWADEGADWIHVVDLDGAFTGSPANLNIVAEIARSVPCPVQVGGGLRDLKSLREAFHCGVSRVILGTRAAESMEFVASAAAEFGSERVAVGVDARGGIVAVRGWTEYAGRRALDVITEAEKAGAGTVIYTDIATDGMLEGPNFKEIESVLRTTKMRVIASGGVSTATDVIELAQRPGLHGVIIGKALYDGRISLRELARHPGLQRGNV